MEENSEAHMDTGVSSTTDDVVEVQEATCSHRNVETVVTVENIKEEDMSSSQQRNNSITKQAASKSIAESDKIMDSAVHKEVPLKTIIIKAANKDYQIVRFIQKSPTKPEETLNPSGKDTQVNKPESSVSEASVEADLTKIPSKASPNKDIDKPTQKSPCRDVEVQEKTQVSPVKDSQPQECNMDKESVVKSTPIIELSHKITPVKEVISKSTPVRDGTPKINFSKDLTIKLTPRELTATVPLVKDVKGKLTPTNEQLSKIVSGKEQPKTAVKQSVLIKSNIDNKDGKSEELSGKTNISTMDIDKEASNDSQVETSSDTSEKEHNKSISRELKSLINSAKESKIISECTQLTSKTRKSRTPLDTSITNLNASVEADKIHGVRRGSDNSQKSGSSEKSDKGLKRSMRSQNPEFVHKVKQFLNSVTGKAPKDGEVSEEEDTSADAKKIKESEDDSMANTPKKKKTEDISQKSNKLRTDAYCWRCHWAVEVIANEKSHPPMHCTVCPRAFHYKCLSSPERNKINVEKNWVCPECMLVLNAEGSETRSLAMKKTSLGMLCDLLKHALERMMDINGVEPFMHPVDRTVFPAYDKYVVHPMDLNLMKQNIVDGLYGSTEAFLADAQWILHNSIIFNTLQSKLTGGARALVRSCRGEMGEIEACPECYAAAHARRPTWFTDVCSTPHVLLWAKLKGFPYWPAKGMSINSSGLVDVRFFGAHDRAWVPARDCFLYSEKDPNNFRTKRQDILDSMQEAEQHIRNISRKYGKFVYPPFKTQFDPTKLAEQLKMMIPSFEGEVRTHIKEKPSNCSPGMVKEKIRSASKSSKGSVNDGDISEGEDPSVSRPRKMADGAEIAMEEEDFSVEKEKVVEVNATQNKESETSRKRRRSDLEEAVITIMDMGKEKRKRVGSDASKRQEDTIIKEILKEASNEEVKVEKAKSVETLKDKYTEPSSTSSPIAKKVPRRGPGMRLISIAKLMKTDNKVIPKDDSETSQQKPISKLEKSPSNEKLNTAEEKVKIQKLDKSNSNEKLNTTEDRTKMHKVDKSCTSEKLNTPDEKPKREEKVNVPEDKTKTQKLDRSNSADKVIALEERTKSQRRRNSKTNKSLNNSNFGKPVEKKNEKLTDSSTNKEKVNTANKNVTDKPVTDKSQIDKVATTSRSITESPKLAKDRLLFDDDTSLAVIARETAKNSNITSNDLMSRLPTITCVRSLSATPQNTATTVTKTTTMPKTIEVTVEATSSIFTPTSTDNVRNMKEAVDKLQKLRSDTEPSVVGRVGVRAFARMTSPPERETRVINNDVQVEIKAEPIDLDDADRHIEKMDLMKAFKLRPVNSPSSLRDVRINKVVTVTAGNSRKVPVKSAEVRPRAKKTFPQPKKPDEGRSELNSKNSMVYIPIQPPITQAPSARMQRPIATNGPVSTPPTIRPISTIATSTPNKVVNTVTTPILGVISSPTPTSAASSNMDTSSVQSVPTIGQVPATVHTVPLITSVNGQWTFSLQPVMSVGSVDGTPSPPMLNGLPERVPPMVPLSNGAVAGPSVVAGPSGVPCLSGVPGPSGVSCPSVVPGPSGVPGPTPAALGSPAPPAPPRAADTSTPGEPPRLQQRPSLMNPLDSNTPVGNVPPPSTAGPVTAKLNQNAVKMTDFFRMLLEDSLEKLDEPVAHVTGLKLQLEQVNWRYQQQVHEIKHTHELTLAEMRASFEKEKLRLVSETRRAAQVELEAAVKLAKSKQWCANCSQEAQFYCCWNTSYCDYPCQRAHWAHHYAVCTQQRTDGNDGNMNPPENRLQPPPENLPKTTAAPAPALTVGGKLAPSRVYSQEQSNSPKSSIIVSMVEDPNGNQTMKCVGTYKPNAPQITPLILNKQLMTTEEAAKKVVTSGGYLIVGASNSVVGAPNSTPSVVTPSRRTHTIQYYT